MEDDGLPTGATKTESSPEVEEPGGTTADVTSTGGRRRGRRKVMRKIQNRDDEGYLGTSPNEFLNFQIWGLELILCAVTSTEAVWETFSEDEPEPPPKPKPKAAVKGKKGAAVGQGNIMSFFAKK